METIQEYAKKGLKLCQLFFKKLFTFSTKLIQLHPLNFKTCLQQHSQTLSDKNLIVLKHMKVS